LERNVAKRFARRQSGIATDAVGEHRRQTFERGHEISARIHAAHEALGLHHRPAGKLMLDDFPPVRLLRRQ
jgi:hypothetical protein